MLITEKDFTHKVTRNDNPIIISFGAVWSGNSEMLSNMLRDLDRKFDGQVDVCLTDIEDYSDLADQYGISEVPTTLVFNNGEVVDFFAGMISKNRIRKKIEKLLSISY